MYDSSMPHQLEHSTQTLARYHSEDRCEGEFCTIHNMSDHPLRSFEQRWIGGTMVRVSPTGEIYPDPDSPNVPERPNAARCLDCDIVLVSWHRHDYKECACGNLMVDGGNSYFRRGWRETSRIEEIRSWPLPANSR